MPSKILASGPWKGVRDTPDPYDDSENAEYLQDATNIYIPDTTSPTGLYARQGFLWDTAATITGTSGKTSCIYNYTAYDGTNIGFLLASGKLYRMTQSGYKASANPLVDVTPAAITIADSAVNGTAGRAYMTQINDQLIVTDGVNRPWIGTNLTATPITGAYIDIDGAAGSWTTQGQPVVYQGSLFFLAKSVPGGSAVKAGVGMVWSEPSQPSVGYVQSTYANFWNLIEQSAQRIYALAATNNVLYYFREYSIGAVQGTPGSNFSSTATRDLVSVNIGTTAPASIVQFGEAIFFVDRDARPYMFRGGVGLEPIWKQMRTWFGNSDLATPTPTLAVGAYVPDANVILLGGLVCLPTGYAAAPNMMFAFDPETGQYMGRWCSLDTTAPFTAGIWRTFESVATLNGISGRSILAVYTVAVNTTPTGTAFVMSLWPLYASSQRNQGWKDGYGLAASAYPVVSAKTATLGYSAGEVMNATESGTIVAQSVGAGAAGTPTPITVTVQTPYTLTTTECTSAAANASKDGTYRTVFGMDVVSARGIQLTVTAKEAAGDGAAHQFVLQRIEFPAVTSRAAVGDQ